MLRGGGGEKRGTLARISLKNGLIIRQTRPYLAKILDMPDEFEISRSTARPRRLHKGYPIGGGAEATKAERLKTEEGHSDMQARER